MGSMLQSRGLMPGMAPEWMIVNKPDAVIDVHRRYIDAGSEMIETNTFGATRHKLTGFGLEDQTERINTEAVELCRKAAGSCRTMVVGSVGPIGELLAPLGTFSPEEAYQNFEEQCRFLANGGADLINIETMSDPTELKLAVMAALNQGIPVMAEASFIANGRMLSGTLPEVAAAILDGFDLTALGVNCSLGPNEMLPILEAMGKATTKPLIVQPNAGIPYLENDQTIFPLGPEEFGENVEALIQKIQPAVIGGCCGTTPDHIRVLRGIVDQYQTRCLTNSKPWVTGRSTGFEWNNSLPEEHITLKPIGMDEIQIGDQIVDLYSAAAHCRKSRSILVMLVFDDWKDHKEGILEWLVTFQMIYSGALGVTTDDQWMLEEFLRVVTGRPLILSRLERKELPAVLQGIPGVYLAP